MTENMIRYRKGYKYQLAEDYRARVSVYPPDIIRTEFIVLAADGTLIVKSGYAWDGPSGPTFDTRSFMRGALEHDALYQLMRLGLLDRAAWRHPADRRLVATCKEDGMWRGRRAWVYRVVRIGARKATLPSGNRPILEAP